MGLVAYTCPAITQFQSKVLKLVNPSMRSASSENKRLEKIERLSVFWPCLKAKVFIPVLKGFA